MASTVTAQLTMNSNTATSDSLNLLVNDVLNVTEPTVGIARVKTTTSANTDIVLKTVSAITYVYIKNTDSANIIVISDNTSATPNAFMDLGPGEFAFVPVKGTKGLSAKATVADCILEYAVFTKA